MIIPESSEKFGFVLTGMGAHTGRTIMLHDLQSLFATGSPESGLQDYKDAILMENALLKPTMSARNEGFRRLRQLYGLDHQLVLFRSLRTLWEQDPEAQPLLALLCAVARDSLLRASIEMVSNLPEGTTITAPDFAALIHDTYLNRFTGKTLASIGRNIASSWTQSGHFSGSTVKTRKLIKARPIATVYALFLAYLCDSRGEALFESPWVRMLDTPKHILHEQAQQAAQLGWLEYRHSGNITEITFRHLLKDQS